jgi:hypothetical protein
MATKHRTLSCEEWRAVPGYEGWYEVSSMGNMRRVGPIKGRPVCRELRPATSGREYKHVGLRKGGSKKVFNVHRLVAIAFLGPPPTPKHQINHIDGNKLNNNVSNLEWVTSAENEAHAARMGLKARGSENGAAKLTESDIPAIRALKGHEPHRVTATRYGVSEVAISLIQLGKTWKHIKS